MTSKLKCPFCQQRLLQEYNRQRDAVIYHCTHCYFQGDGILWQELIRTRKALEITTDAIDEILVLDSGKFCKEPAENRESAKNAQEVDEIEQAEKWVGKLCWFSQLYGCYQHIAILKRISESGLYVTDDGELHYAYCEPVKSDDPIIYKGK